MQKMQSKKNLRKRSIFSFFVGLIRTALIQIKID